jgi:ribonuclease VapC
MIVDTSALVAIVNREEQFQDLARAMGRTNPMLPAPALTEFFVVTAGRSTAIGRMGEELIRVLRRSGLEIVPYEERHAAITRRARDAYGKGNGRGGLLNIVDLMVYAVAKDRAAPILCTGRDFASTDAMIHPASRTA